MGLSQIPLFQGLTDKMKWHQTRQSLLAENVANAETPGYAGRDLKAFDFGDVLQTQQHGTISFTTTNPSHIAAQSLNVDGFTTRKLNNFELTPEGNGVTLEDEMMKVTGNQMDYDTVASLYTKSMKLLRTALGKQA